jgi:uncharacterized protein
MTAAGPPRGVRPPTSGPSALLNHPTASQHGAMGIDTRSAALDHDAPWARTADGHTAGGVDHVGLAVLSREECLRLVGTARIGRVGMTSAALPLVLPVNFALDGEEIVIRTAAGTKLDAALRNAVVAFEVDEIDPLYHSGWSVMVTGMAREMRSEEDLARARSLPLRPWAPGTRDAYIAIPVQLISGRRIVHDAPPVPSAP